MFRFRWEGLTEQVLKPTGLNRPGLRIYCGWKMSPIITVNKGSFSDIKLAVTAAALTAHPEGTQDGEKQATGLDS